MESEGLSSLATLLVPLAVAAGLDILRRILRKYRHRGVIIGVLYTALEKHKQAGGPSAKGAQAVVETAKMELATVDTAHHLRELALSYAASVEDGEGKASARLRARKQKRKPVEKIKRALAVLPILGALADGARYLRKRG